MCSHRSHKLKGKNLFINFVEKKKHKFSIEVIRKILWLSSLRSHSLASTIYFIPYIQYAAGNIDEKKRQTPNFSVTNCWTIEL